MSIEFTCPECGERNTVGPEFAGRRGTCAFCSAQVIVPQTSGVAQSATPLPQAGAPACGSRRSSTPWVVILLAVCGVLVVCGGILIPHLLSPHQAARRVACMNNLKTISLALLAYEEKHGRFPPEAVTSDNGDPPMSWRVAILPEIEEAALYDAYHAKEPWNSPANGKLIKAMPRLFRCPSDGDGDAAEGETSYVMITGKNTVGGVPGDSGTAVSDIRDGLHRTILVMEVHGLKIPWTEPRDITLDELMQRLRTSGGRIGHVSGFNVGMGDGSVRFLPVNIDPESLRRLAIINDGLPVTIGDN